MADTNISPEHRDSFKALTSGDYANFALFSCFVNGEPASAIVAVTKDDGRRISYYSAFRERDTRYEADRSRRGWTNLELTMVDIAAKYIPQLVATFSGKQKEADLAKARQLMLNMALTRSINGGGLCQITKSNPSIGTLT